MDVISKFERGQQVAERLYLVGCEKRDTNTRPPKCFLSLIFTDGQSNIEAKYWNWDRNKELFSINQPYEITAETSEYMGKMQLSITTMSPSANDDITMFVKSVGVPQEELKSNVTRLIGQIEDAAFRVFVNRVVYETPGYFTSTSALGNHHVGIGGNALHSIEVAKAGLGIADAFPYLRLNKDLIIAGGLLHDIGKLTTYATNGPQIEYTENGHLFDHIMCGTLLIESVFTENYPNEDALHSKVMLLIHIIASHHGQLEYGSPVMPKFMEAVIVSIADSASATLNTFENANIEAGTNLITAKLWSQGNKPVLTQERVKQLFNAEV